MGVGFVALFGAAVLNKEGSKQQIGMATMKSPLIDLRHFVTHHLSLTILFIGLVYGAIYLIIRSAARSVRTGDHRPKKVRNFKRRQRDTARGRKRR